MRGVDAIRDKSVFRVGDADKVVQPLLKVFRHHDKGIDEWRQGSPQQPVFRIRAIGIVRIASMFRMDAHRYASQHRHQCILDSGEIIGVQNGGLKLPQQ